jgi:hypothetical protein
VKWQCLQCRISMATEKHSRICRLDNCCTIANVQCDSHETMAVFVCVVGLRLGLGSLLVELAGGSHRGLAP